MYVDIPAPTGFEARRNFGARSWYASYRRIGDVCWTIAYEAPRRHAPVSDRILDQRAELAVAFAVECQGR